MNKSLLSLFGIILLAGCAPAYKVGVSHDALFQVGLYSKLADGNYDGRITISELKKCGDFGLGTFDGLDGEMVVLDGKVYQVFATGIVQEASNSATTPFAVTTSFEQDTAVNAGGISGFTLLQSVLDSLIPNKNVFYAVRIEGLFRSIKTRSVPKQQKPYPLLIDALKTQSTFEFENIRGVMVGFYSPAFIDGINVAGYHFHFMSDDKTRGGHVLECSVQQATIVMDETEQFTVQLP